MKNFKNKKLISLAFMILMIVMINSASSILTNAISNTHNYGDDYSLYTDSVKFTYMNIDYTIDDYKNSLSNSTEKLLYRHGTTLSIGSDNTVEYNINNDDPIIKIVPKKLFTKSNIEVVHYGKEYGFFIKTQRFQNNVIHSNVYIFKLIYNNVINHIQLGIEPLFQREFIYVENIVDTLKTRKMNLSEELGDSYDGSVSIIVNNVDIVVPLPYDYTFFFEDGFIHSLSFEESDKYYMTNVYNTIAIANEQHLNFGDSEYNVKDDNGKFIIQEDVSYSAKIYDKNEDAIKDVAKVMVKAVFDKCISLYLDKLGVTESVDILKALYDAYASTFDNEIEIENRFTYNPYPSTKDGQINENGNLIKTAVTTLSLKDNDSNTIGDYTQNDILFYGIGDSFISDYLISYTPIEKDNGEYSPIWDCRLAYGWSFDFRSFADSSYLLETGDIFELQLNKDNNREYKDLSNDPLVYLLPEGENVFKFTPKISGEYELFTSGADNDIIFNQLNGDSLKAEENIGHDKKFKYELLKDQEYTFSIKYADSANYGHFNLNYVFNPNKLTLGDNNNLDIKYIETFYEFEVMYNANYKIVAENLSNHQLINEFCIYDENFSYISTLQNNSIDLVIGKYYISINKTNEMQENINIKITDSVNIEYKNIGIANNMIGCSDIYSLATNTILPEPESDGGEFLGWYLDSEYTVEVTDSNIADYLNFNLELYAKWSLNTYEIVYYINPNKDIIIEEYQISNCDLSLIKDVSIVGYIFLGWYDNENFDGDSIAMLNSRAYGNKIFYSKWAKEESKITFNLNSCATDDIVATMFLDNNEYQSDNINIDYQTEVSLPIPKCVGFIFCGWYLGDKSISDENGIMNNQIVFYNDETITAHWKRCSYILKLDIEEFESGEKTILTLKSLNGINLKTFNSYSYAISDNMFNLEILSQEEYFALPGYNFVGFTTIYNDIESRITMIDVNLLTSAEQVLYTYYEIINYNISFQTDFGNTDYTINTNYNRELNNLNSEKQSYSFENPTKNYYTFIGWINSKSEIIFNADKKITEEGISFLANCNNIIGLMAKFEPLNMTINFSSDYSSFQETQTINYDSKIKLVVPELCDGRIFKGWSTTKDDINTIITDENGNLIDVWTKTEDTNLFAIWEGNQYTITLNLNGGVLGIKNATVIYGEDMPNVVCPARIGYTFMGYYLDLNDESTKYYNADKTSAKKWDIADDATLYAKWEIKTYNIIYSNPFLTDYESSNCELIAYVRLEDELCSSYYYDDLIETDAPKKIAYGETINILNVKAHYTIQNQILYNVKSSYVFEGWYKDENRTIRITSITCNEERDYTVYGKWRYEISQVILNRTYTINDSGRFEQRYDILGVGLNKYNSFDFVLYENLIELGIKSIKVDIKINIWEIDDGYQYLFIYDGLSEDSEYLWGQTIEHGSSGRDKNAYTHEFQAKISIEKLYNCTNLILRYGASGYWEDDWKNNEVVIDIEYTTDVVFS